MKASTEDVTPPSSPGERLRLFCFHHAGGAASVFSGWPAALPPGIDVVPVQLPGRESRRREAIPHDLDSLITALDAELSDRVRAPYAFYGHSMGGTVAYQLAKRYAARDGDAPVALLLGACPAPHLRPALQEASFAGEDTLVSAMVRIGGLSADVLRYPAWLRAATDLLRADLRVLASERPGGEAVATPIHLFHGTGDPLVSEEELAAWAHYTTAECVLHRVDGGHFFVRDADPGFFRTLAAILSPLPEPNIR
ncbi:alpha/beta fold hydrolase [Amycolatopsis sp. NPDC024027]|uniref:thioesterase II family protein n=1 Tax=Amycolatopsis sp. NPDC024027 TaxID=3154327 RepID=UPI0033ED4F73